MDDLAACRSSQKRSAFSQRGRILPAAVAAACLLLAGCEAPQPYRTEDRLTRGLVIVLPGVEGRSRFNEAIARGLDKGGVNWAIEIYDWTSPLGPLYNLRAEDRNRSEASRLSWRISRYILTHPGRPVVLVGQSGGGAMAVWAAENLMPDYRLDGIILLAAALSPDYCLDFALDNTRRGIISFYSLRDWVFLGVGTTLAGTMDGRHGASAGRVGFRDSLDEEPAAGWPSLLQIPWEPRMAEVGHSGSHLTSGAEDFVARYVAAMILADGPWDEDLVAKVIGGQAVGKPTGASGATSRPATAPAAAPAAAPAGVFRIGAELPDTRSCVRPSIPFISCRPVRIILTCAVGTAATFGANDSLVGEASLENLVRTAGLQR